MCGHLRVACRRKLSVADREGCPLCLEVLVSGFCIRKSKGKVLSPTLDFGFDIVDGIGRLHLKGDCLSRESFDENLHDGLDRNSR